ncbi:MAG: hypothetical protein CFE46_01490 [Burkholderiales bacterium PBB6]|nr:MAG: hypothetical protein CFE46_01490 [Burkholderiales bacterium PBB6]
MIQALNQRASPRWLSPAALWMLAGLLIGSWWLGAPYMGLGHDALYYAGDALRRSVFPGLQHDPFFGTGSQGNFTLYPHVFDALLGHTDIHTAALILTISAKLVWLVALAVMCRAALQQQPRWVLAFALVLALPTAYDPQRILSYGESFTTPRHWAEAVVMLSIAAQLHGRPWLALAGSLLSCTIHPLMGLAGLVLNVFALPGRWRLIVMAAGALSVALLCALGLGPFAHVFAAYDDAWWEIVRTRNSIATIYPWDADMVAKVAAWLALWLHATRRLGDDPAAQRTAWAGIAGTVVLLGFFAVGALFHNVLLVKLQLVRGWWLAQVLAPIFIVKAMADVHTWRPVDRMVVALTLAALMTDLWSCLAMAACALALANLPAVNTWLEKRLGPTLGLAPWLAYGVLAITVVTRLARIEFNAVAYKLLWNDPHPLVTASASEPALTIGLGLALLWLLRTVFKDRLPARVGAVLGLALASTGLGFWLHQAQVKLDHDPEWEAALRQEIPANATVHWDNNLPLVWILLGHPAYATSPQTAGALFDRPTAMELTRRLNWLDQHHLGTGQDTSLRQSEKGRSAGYDDIVRACADEALDVLLLDHERAGATKVFRRPGKPPISIFDCRVLRTSGKS